MSIVNSMKILYIKFLTTNNLIKRASRLNGDILRGRIYMANDAVFRGDMQQGVAKKFGAMDVAMGMY